MSAWSRLKASLGLAEKATPKVRGAIVGPVPLGYQLARIGGSLTPAIVSSILREADAGNPARLMDLENEARQKDCHLQSILGTREQAVSGLPFEVVPADGEEKAKSRDKKIAAWCKERLDAIDCFPTLLAHLSGATYHGHAVAETLFAKVDGDVVPCEFSLLAPRRFVFDEAQRLRWLDEGGPRPGIDLAAKYPGRFIIHQPRVNGDIPCREGLGRVLMWAALFRNWDMRDWLSLAELSWKPWRIGTYAKAASDEDIDNLEEAIDKLSSSAVAVVPETTELEVSWPEGGGKSNHGELMAFLGAEMSKAVLGATTTVEQGERGALALGKVHNEIRKDIRESDARQLAATLRRDLLGPMVRQTWGESVPVPVLRFLTEDAVDVNAFANAIKTLKEAGLPIPIAHIYDVTGIPEPKDDEEVLGEGEEDMDVSGLEGEEPEGEEAPNEPAAAGEKPKPKD